MASQLPLKLHLDSTYSPAVLDLEGSIPYDIVLQVRRGATDLTRPMNILTDNSLFDIPYAFSKNLLRVIDLGSNEQVDLGAPTTPTKPTAQPRIFTLPPRTSRLPLFEYDLVIPLQLSTHIRHALLPNHQYRVELNTIDLGIKWWNYGTDTNPNLPTSTTDLPPSEPAQLVAPKPTHRDFSVISSLPIPPTISIALSLSSPTIHRSNPTTLLRATITNQSPHTITLRSSGDQSYIRPSNNRSLDSNHPRITSTSPPPSIFNFSITSASTGAEFVPQPKHICAGSSRRIAGLTTLEPGVPFINEFKLMEGADAILTAMADEESGGEFRVRLREMGVWWAEGKGEEVLGGGGEGQVPGLGRVCWPLMLRCEDEVVVRVVG
ncbi:MAG: hypothetical protein OHK93_004649 [Ramalina farinacea]|uniref:Uncharacterized protein n=1 Tax=Ramalina farinacea TaxID=258253 RepID=A0AA43QWY8_9LECA|nr:hypothetical protein [Ramalina farinacea]